LIDHPVIATAVSATVATDGLLDVHVTSGAGPGVPLDSVVATVKPSGSVSPLSRFAGSGTVAFAGEIASELTAAAVTARNAGTVCGVEGRVQIEGSVAEIVVPG
jgi:hypothetical protein